MSIPSKKAISKPEKAGTKPRVLMALSGGIDSAVSAYLLKKQGYEVEAAFMKNWSSTEGLKYDECPWLTDRQDALRVAAFLQIPMHTVDFEQQYKKTVLNYFFEEYKAGRTPNPDVMCNKEIKFKLLYDWAMKRGFDFLATGHYAQIISTSNSKKDKNVAGEYCLARSADEFKDQTYFIYNIQTKQLPHILFPIGAMKKSAVKSMAKRLKLPNADKKESMGLCFVGRIRLKDFLEQKLKPKRGLIIDINSGAEIGRHEGLYYYTIGQRQGIKVGAGGPYYVARKDLAANALYVTTNPKDKALETYKVELHSVNWITEPKQFPVRLMGRFRHQGVLESLAVDNLGQGRYNITFKKPQTAVASGQSLVLYDKNICMGGGVIV